jgi:hypothetical protein
VVRLHGIGAVSAEPGLVHAKRRLTEGDHATRRELQILLEIHVLKALQTLARFASNRQAET